ncbi:hypothetical protein K435DRAFT_389058 [Dendrothele bispora CBS 962.96]|uniref:Uncharacterized protein n=1 Tax=Dendrothele bispora (strain CBS 962.96) TaxID=1314807 RepID=A0A4S8MHG7_DENBC|nr:hypothetical protein K435DRAFT_389058 [Dendrothele bispora CBS 962.96]
MSLHDYIVLLHQQKILNMGKLLTDFQKEGPLEQPTNEKGVYLLGHGTGTTRGQNLSAHQQQHRYKRKSLKDNHDSPTKRQRIGTPESVRQLKSAVFKPTLAVAKRYGKGRLSSPQLRLIHEDEGFPLLSPPGSITHTWPSDNITAMKGKGSKKIITARKRDKEENKIADSHKQIARDVKSDETVGKPIPARSSDRPRRSVRLANTSCKKKVRFLPIITAPAP